MGHSNFICLPIYVSPGAHGACSVSEQYLLHGLLSTIHYASIRLAFTALSDLSLNLLMSQMMPLVCLQHPVSSFSQLDSQPWLS